MTWTGGALTGIAPIIIAEGAQLNVAGAGLMFSARPLEIDGLASVAAGGNQVLVVPSLTLGGAAKFDLADNALIINYSGPSPMPSVAADITSGYNDGAWDGAGIDSSTAASSSDAALGYAEASDLFANFPATFAGQQVDDTAVLVRYTRAGDANLDAAINLLDFDRLASNFNATGALLEPRRLQLRRRRQPSGLQSARRQLQPHHDHRRCADLRQREVDVCSRPAHHGAGGTVIVANC